jgi:predicted alpha/beta hydrolase family esterase
MLWGDGIASNRHACPGQCTGERVRGLSPLYLYHSRDDAESPFEHLERYRSVLPQATVRVLDGRGHEFNQAQFPELVADIRGLATRRAI